MKKRIFSIIKFLFKVNFENSIDQKKIIIFDCVNSYVLTNILEKNNYFLLSTRLEKISKIYLNKNIILFMVRNIFKRRIKLNYLISLINEINPTVVVTNIDNSVEFSLLSKFFLGKRKFLAIQFANRGDIANDQRGFNKLLYFTNLICIGEFDYHLLKDNDIKIHKHFIAGSLKDSFYEKNINKNNENKKFDICFMGKQWTKNSKLMTNFFFNQEVILEYLMRYLDNKNLRLAIQSKQEKNEPEEKIYHKFMIDKKIKCEILWRNSDDDASQSYETLSQSKIVIGPPSTMLREAFNHGAKVLCLENEPVKLDKHPFGGFIYLSKFNYGEFKKKLDQIFEIDVRDYYKKLPFKVEYYIKKENTVNFVKSLVEEKNYLLK